MIVGAYGLDLYCDGHGCPRTKYGRMDPVQFTAETGGRCRAIARKKGWKLDIRNGDCLCPECAAEGAKLPKESRNG